MPILCPKDAVYDEEGDGHNFGQSGGHNRREGAIGKAL